MKFKGRDRTRYGKRHKPGEMNQTEAAYAELLEAERLAGQVLWWRFEAVTLKLADDSRWTPDFAVLYSDLSMEFVDCKGGGPIDPNSMTKIKFAADKFPMFGFAQEKKRAKKDGGGFERREF